MAGRHGDGLITGSKDAQRRELQEAFRTGARAAGKDPAKLAVVVEHWVVVGNQAEAERFAPLWQFSPRAWQLFVNYPDPRAIQRDAARQVPRAEVMARWVVSEDPEVHLEAIRRLIEAGVTHIFIHSPQDDQQRVIEFYREQVLPRVRHARALR